MSPLRMGVIGCGWVNSQHAANLSRLLDRVELVGFVDSTAQKAADMARRFGSTEAQVYPDHQALFSGANLDAVVIGIPPFAHTNQVHEAARRGIHIFIEKPIALTVEKAWQMVDEVEKAGIVTQVGFMYRFGAVVERLKMLLDSGKAGNAGMVTARYFCNSLHTEWWRHKEKSGGQVFEQAIHLVDLMRYLLGPAETVYSLQRNLFHQDVPDYTVEDVSASVFGFQSGAIGVLSATNGAIPMRWEYDMRLVAKNLTVYCTDANHAELTWTAGQQRATETIGDDRDVYALEMNDFLAAIEGQATTRTPMREGALTLELVVAANRSAESHREECV